MFFLSAYFQFFLVVFCWGLGWFPSCSVAVAVDFVLKQLINYLNNYLCSCCGGVVLVTSAVFVLMVVLVVVDEVGVVAEIIFIFGYRIAQKRRKEKALFRISRCCFLYIQMSEIACFILHRYIQLLEESINYFALHVITCNYYKLYM